MTTLLERLLSSDEPFAAIWRGDQLEVMTGRVIDVATTADIALDGRPILALVPFRQLAERGFEVFDDGAQLRTLQVSEQESVDLGQALALLPAKAPVLESGAFDIGDEDYATQVQGVIDHEIGRGEGANFVLHRAYTGRVQAPQRQVVAAYLAALLTGERGAYWTFAAHLGDVALAGASPERHVSLKDGVVTMNPISGTYRHPPAGPDVAGMLTFLTDAKEVDELFMVVDEELKLMATVCPGGGRVVGPFLKPMSHVTHTEYLLEGRSDLDPREVLRQTMFAPTVTGAPMANACRVIKRREARGRGYYAGVAALFEPTTSGYDMDAPILIRTAYVDPAGQVRVPVGATLVRHSDPTSEVAETATKAAGLLTAIGARRPGKLDSGSTGPNSGQGGLVTTQAGPEATQVGSKAAQAKLGARAAAVAGDPKVAQTLRYRNERLSPFWFRQFAGEPQGLAGLRVRVADAEDGFSQMLAHQLRRLGAKVEVVGWAQLAALSNCGETEVESDSAEARPHGTHGAGSSDAKAQSRDNGLAAKAQSRGEGTGQTPHLGETEVEPDSAEARPHGTHCAVSSDAKAQSRDNGLAAEAQSRGEGTGQTPHLGETELWHDVLLAGPGPGDPDLDEPRIAALRAAIAARLVAGEPVMCVCLSHQILCRCLGLDLRALARPNQGIQLTDSIFGHSATLGYYNTFTAAAPLASPWIVSFDGLKATAGLPTNKAVNGELGAPTAGRVVQTVAGLPANRVFDDERGAPTAGRRFEVEVARRQGTDEVIGLRGTGFVSLQGHPESALSTNGLEILAQLMRELALR
ncbi:MAG: chorismate-binding protein [Micrococcales bacterium]|nr:chorismate-binding protein [Micrococcales bacterium]